MTTHYLYLTDDSGNDLRVDQNNFLVDPATVYVTLDELLTYDRHTFLTTIQERAGFSRMLASYYSIDRHDADGVWIALYGDVSVYLEPKTFEGPWYSVSECVAWLMRQSDPMNAFFDVVRYHTRMDEYGFTREVATAFLDAHAEAEAQRYRS